MRDPERIPRFLVIVEKIWKQSPDLRFYQMIANCLPYDKDSYYIEDPELLARLIQTYGLEADDEN